MDQTVDFIAVTRENLPAPQNMFTPLYYPNLLLFLALSIIVKVIRSRNCPPVFVRVGLVTVRFQEGSVFCYLVTKNNNRFDMGLAVTDVMLNHVLRTVCHFWVNIFLCDTRLPRERDINFSFFSAVHREVPGFVRDIPRRSKGNSIRA
jgi:hypothetical protein